MNCRQWVVDAVLGKADALTLNSKQLSAVNSQLSASTARTGN